MNDSTPLSILVVEDDSSLRQMITLSLKMSGFQVRSACNGVEAQSLYHASRPDLIITDLHMPKMDGIRLVQWLREEEKSDTPVLVLTSLGDGKAGEMALQAGANRIGNKPMDLPKLLETISEIMSD